VALSWSAALDCDGNAVAGYNLYRRLATEETYTKLNSALISGLTHTDTGLSAAPAGATYYYALNSAPITGLTHTDTGFSAAPAGVTYYYALSAVDGTGDESVKSAAAGLTIADSGGGAGGGSADCVDGCPADPGKLTAGVCGCGVADVDTDGDGRMDCLDDCINTADTDGDGVFDCDDLCPHDPLKTAPGACGCGIGDADVDQDGVADCNDPDGGNPSNGRHGGGRGSCFISASGLDLSPERLKPLGAIALLACLIGWSGAARLEERAGGQRGAALCALRSGPGGP
jgi:hypothetical protein